MEWTLGELARASGAELEPGAEDVVVRSVGTDSRSLPADSLFVALRGERFDGHAFVHDAVQKGARGVVVDQAGNEGFDDVQVPRLMVRDTLRALGDMAAHVRSLRAEPVVAITGSNGKTSTKELAASVLSARGLVHKTHGNLNNLIGAPLTVFDWPWEAWAAVLELGMNAPGEIDRLTEIVSPTVGVITNVGAAHVGFFSDERAIARAKGELFARLPEDAVAVINLDDPLVTEVATVGLKSQRQVGFGWSVGADVRLVSCEASGIGQRLILSVGGEEYPAELPLHGAHQATNAAAAVACAYALGLEPGEACAALAEVELPAGRMRLLQDVHPTLEQVNVVDDSYNANPASTRAALGALTELAGNGRRVAVLGEMFELGERAAELHRGVGRASAESGVELTLALGAHADDVIAGVVEAGGRGAGFADLETLLEDLNRNLRAHDWVLVKGSRGMQMERVVEHLRRPIERRDV